MTKKERFDNCFVHALEGLLANSRRYENIVLQQGNTVRSYIQGCVDLAKMAAELASSVPNGNDKQPASLGKPK